MKKQLLFILSILFCSCSLIAQSPNARKIDLTQRGGNIKDGRSDFPLIYIDTENSRWDISYYSAGSASLEIKDRYGNIEYECTLNSDGKSHVYILPFLPTGIYIVVVEVIDGAIFEGKIFM